MCANILPLSYSFCIITSSIQVYKKKNILTESEESCTNIYQWNYYPSFFLDFIQKPNNFKMPECFFLLFIAVKTKILDAFWVKNSLNIEEFLLKIQLLKIWKQGGNKKGKLWPWKSRSWVPRISYYVPVFPRIEKNITVFANLFLFEKRYFFSENDLL